MLFPSICRKNWAYTRVSDDSIGDLQQLYSHTRFTITFRAGKSKYKSILLFRLASPTNAPDESPALTPTSRSDQSDPSQHVQNGQELQIYAMEAQCPHLGADLSHSEIEEYEEDLVAVCPWHRYVGLLYGHTVNINQITGMILT